MLLVNVIGNIKKTLLDSDFYFQMLFCLIVQAHRRELKWLSKTQWVYLNKFVPKFKSYLWLITFYKNTVKDWDSPKFKPCYPTFWFYNETQLKNRSHGVTVRVCASHTQKLLHFDGFGIESTLGHLLLLFLSQVGPIQR